MNQSEMSERMKYGLKIRHISQYLMHRKIWIVFAIILFLSEVTLLAGPAGMAGEDYSHFLTGEGSWEVTDSKDEEAFYQQFSPMYSHLERISLLFQNGGQDLTDGYALVTITDSDGNQLLSREISYQNISYGSYTDIDMGIVLKSRKTYYLTVDCRPAENGAKAMVSVCSGEYEMRENSSLYYTKNIPADSQEEVKGAQLVTRYSYSHAISTSRWISVVLISLFTALGIAIGLPENRKIRTIFGILLLIVTPIILGYRLEDISLSPNHDYLASNAMVWCIAIMYLLEAGILLCTLSFRISIILPNTMLAILYSANYFVKSYRGTPLKWNDIIAFRTAANVMGNYTLQPSSNMMIAWSILLMIIVYGAYCGKKLFSRVPSEKKLSCKARIGLRVVAAVMGLVLLLGSGNIFLNTDFLDRQGFLTFHTTDDWLMYEYNGFLISTFLDIKSTRILPPDGYSVKEAENLLTASDVQNSTSNEDLPHVILIMNESFSDLRMLGNLQLSEENMPFFYSLTDNTVRGTAHASVIGGGTANTEFEMFTGCSMGFMPRGYYPYMQCLKRPVNSMISDMKKAGYTTWSMHPAPSTNWNRDRVYQFYGFDNSLWEKDFKDADTIHSGVSDRETYKKLVELYENRTEGEKLFLFDLTIQNHGGYLDNDSGHDIRALNVSSQEANTFLSLMKESDEALEELIQYFDGQEEKVIICFFGDHQPKFGDEHFYKSVYQQTEDLTETDKLLNQYKTPFLIWTNYDIPEIQDIEISMNYLGLLLMKIAGVERSPFFDYLEGIVEKYPVMTANGYLDQEGNYREWTGNEFLEYRIMQYYLLFGAK